MGQALIRALEWAGRHARWILSLGCVAAMFLPDVSAALRPVLPALVSMVLALAMARIDLVATARGALRPGRLLILAGIAVLMLPVTAVIYGGLGRLIGEAYNPSLVYLAAAPPIASAAGLCFLLGFNARLAVEVTVATTLLTPILGPLAIELALPGAEVPLEPLALAIRLAGMIAGGTVAAIIIRALVGPERIAQRAQVFDGVAALGMLLFVFPLFDRVPEVILADPARAAFVLALCFAFNIGMNLATRAVAGRFLTAPDAGTAGLLMGNRNISMFLAALPFEPVFALFVALYQFPMYFTPLLLRRLALSPQSTSEDTVSNYRRNPR